MKERENRCENCRYGRVVGGEFWGGWCCCVLIRVVGGGMVRWIGVDEDWRDCNDM